MSESESENPNERPVGLRTETLQQIRRSKRAYAHEVEAMTAELLANRSRPDDHPMDANDSNDLTDREKQVVAKLAKSLMNDFTWDRTPQGYDYWSTVHQQLERLYKC